MTYLQPQEIRVKRKKMLNSKLALGTVQFGLNYGITNQTGQLSIDEAKDILDFAKEKNIITLDTAALYGSSEKVLGEIGVNDYLIITKTTPLKDDVDEVINNFSKSLENLNRNQLEGLLVHDIGDIENKNFDLLFEKLNALKEMKLVNKIGFSTYTPEQIDFILNNYDFDIVQAPINVFDTRLLDSDQLQALKKKDIEIYARSVFLQGLLLEFDSLSDYFCSWEKKFCDYQNMVEESGFSLLEYALNFVSNIKEVDKVLVGVGNFKQFLEIVEASQKKISEKLLPFSINDINLLNPSLWK
jgi:aryl-alcohol dehydrogenase-like predicted oxidoreductase